MTSGQELDRLLSELASGSDAAFAGIWQLLAPSVLGYLRAQGAAEPEDVCSEVFLGAFRSMERFTGDGAAFRSWLFSIAHRRLTDERRRLGRRPTVALTSSDGSEAGEDPRQRVTADVEHDAAQRMGTEWVMRTCEDLAPDQRDVLLRVVCDLTIEQIADVLGKTAGAVKALQRRAIASVGRQLLGNRSGRPVPF